ncbi:MAG: hypothetical protein K2X34_12435, partial [Hyphomonadaceae bacterium]|nr:hypothetical protein [Hyphomonadaceae bacterium]
YEALRQEALYDASADLSSATSALAQSVSAVPGAGAALETPIAIAPQLAGWLAADMQNQRLRDGSEAIRNAVQRLAPALTEERRIYVGFAEDFATREADVRAAIIESGLSPSQRSAERLVTSLGLPLASNSEAIIARSPALQAAIASADAVAARDRVRLITRSYETSEAAMTALVAAHLRFEQSREPDLADLNRTLGELTAIISALRAGEAAPAAPAG